MFLPSQITMILLTKMFKNLFTVTVPPNAVLRRPIAGSQVPCCPLEKNISECWSSIEPSTFKVRGLTYFR